MAERRSVSTVSRRRLVGIGAGALLLATRPATARQAGDEYTFIVAGIDSRENYGDFNSDVLMVSRVDTRLATMRTMAIPRDLYVEIPGVGMDKINRAFDHGYKRGGMRWEAGAALLTRTVQASFGLETDGVASTTFEGLARIIDAVGGVEVNNPYGVAGDATVPWFPAGPQVLDGPSALVFVRTRAQDSDDGRVMRQQLVLAALLDRLRDPATLGDLPALLEATSGAVDTNIPLRARLALLELLPDLSAESVVFGTMTEHLSGGVIDNGMWVYQADWDVLPGIVQGFLAGE